MARIEGSDGADNRSGTAGADEFAMRGGADVARGLGGNDLMHGGGGNDILYGGDGADRLFGDTGRDELYGGPGADTLVGGPGIDRLTGGAGADKFEFNAVLGADQFDYITDFNRAADIIDLRDIDANWNVAGNQSYHFIGENVLTGRAGELGYQSHDGISFVFGDNDGDGQVDFKIWFTTEINFTASDFLL